MTKYIFIFFLLTAFKLQAQQNCPSDYEERTVKCNGQFVQKCVPVNYSCKLCWAVEYPPCPENKNGGSDFYNSYEKAFSAAQKEANGSNWSSGKCLWYDNRSYKIYLDESKFCAVSNSNLTALNDLKNKIIPFLKRYKAEISNYRRYFSGKPYKPGAIIKEYESMLKQAEDNVKKLENYLNITTDQNLSEIETAFNDIQNEETKLQQTHSNYESYINNNSTSNIAVSTNTNRSTEQNSVTDIVEQNNKLLESQRQSIKEQNENITATLNVLYDVLQKSSASKYLQGLENERREQFNSYKSALSGGRYILVQCDECNGTGTKSHKPCNRTGKITCNICRGTGKNLSNDDCTYCRGTGYQYCNSGCSGTGVFNCNLCQGTGLVLSRIKTSQNSPITNSNTVQLGNSTSSNNKIEDFEATTIDGKDFSLSSYSDKTVLFVFWSSDNQESLNEYKFHCQLLDKYKLNNIIVVGIAAETSRYKWTSSVNESNLAGINISDLNGYHSTYFEKFGIGSVPYSILIDKDGNIKQAATTIRLFTK